MQIVVVGGAGHVGLPLALVLADVGHDVTIIDTNHQAIKNIFDGKFPFLEEGGNELLSKILQTNRLSHTSNNEDVKYCDVIILTVGTPVDEHLNPDLSLVYDAIEKMRPFLRNGQVIILRSTLFPGTSEKIFQLIQNQGTNVGLCFCPERVAQGSAIKEIMNFPQIISGSSKHALGVAKELFSDVAPETIELGLTEAELAKLFTNTWRYITFSIANQFYMIAKSKGMDFYRIKDALSKNYQRAQDLPDAGFTAGPCLFKDTMQLAAFNSHNFSLGHAAMTVNETLPNFLVESVKKELGLNGLNVGILGMAFKPNNDDKRESLAYKLRELLLHENANVFCTDVYIEDEGFFSIETVMMNCDLIFMGCPHREYDNIDFREKTVVNCWSSK